MPDSCSNSLLVSLISLSKEPVMLIFFSRGCLPLDNERSEHREMLLYKISLLEKCGLVQKALEELHNKESKIQNMCRCYACILCKFYFSWVEVKAGATPKVVLKLIKVAWKAFLMS